MRNTITQLKCAVLLPALMLAGLCAIPGWATVVDDRITTCLNNYIQYSTYPNPRQAGDDWDDVMLRVEGKLGKATAIFEHWATRSAAERTTATLYIDQVCNEPTNNPVPDYGRDPVFPSHFSTPLMVRLLLDPALSTHLTTSNTLNLRRVLWQFIDHRSMVSSATATVWYSYSSENHNMLDRSSILLALLALSPTGDGYDSNLADGQSIGAHLAAWKKHFFEYFRQRAREGLNWEVASHYNEMTLACWYNVMDLMDSTIPVYGAYGDDNLAAMAKQTVDLFWATNASEFMPLTGLRCGPAGTRLYEANINEGVGDMRRLLYAYEWHDDFDYSWLSERRAWFHISNMVLFLSDYRMPAVIDHIAQHPDAKAFLYTGRRPGKGPNGNEATAVFGPDHSADIRRDVWWHPAYVIGGLTIRTDLAYGAPDAYVHGIDSDRVMGVFFSSDKDDRILFYGKPDVFEGGSGAAVNTVCGQRFLMGGWDRNATHNAGVRFFISDGQLQDHKVDENGWIFTTVTAQAPFGVVYAGIRICNGGYTTSTKNDHGWPSQPCGLLLDFNDKLSPFILEVATASDGYANLAAFQADCMNNAYSYDTTTKKMTYTSCAGDKYEFTGNSGELPKVGLGGATPTTVNLNPVKTYDNPYVQGWHGSDTAMYSDGSSTTILDFNYDMSPMWDDYQTKALWHMEALVGDKVIDDDLDYSDRNRNNDLTVSGATIAAGSGPTALLGNSLDFDGVNDIATAVYNATGPKGWASYPKVKIDFWFKADSLPAAGQDRTIVAAENTWDFRQFSGGTNLRLYVWNTNGKIDMAEVTGHGAIDVWHHVTGAIWNNQVSLTVDGVTRTTATAYPMKQQNARIDIGGYAMGNSRYFDGKIDDVKIRIPSPDEMPPPTAWPTPTKTPTNAPTPSPTGTLTAIPTATPTLAPTPTKTPLPPSKATGWRLYGGNMPGLISCSSR